MKKRCLSFLAHELEKVALPVRWPFVIVCKDTVPLVDAEKEAAAAPASRVIVTELLRDRDAGELEFDTVMVRVSNTVEVVLREGGPAVTV